MCVYPFLQVLPALKSFCMYAAIGIIALYFLQATYFVAWFTLDQRRVENKGNAFICCWKMNSWQPNKCSQRNFCKYFFSNILANFLMKPFVKFIVIFFSLAFFGISAWGLANLKQDFNVLWFLPKDSYLYKFVSKRNEFYPSSGAIGQIYFGDIRIYEQLAQIEELVESLEASEYIGEVDCWYTSYKQYFEKQGYLVPDPDITEESFSDDLSMFLFSPSGSQYREKNFQFATPLNCTEPTPKILASSINFRYKKFEDSSMNIAAMHSVKNIAERCNITGDFVAAFSRSHKSWEIDEIIEVELYQNITLAVVVVFLMTFALIASFVQSLLVMSCVVMTLVDVGALMHWWGLSIDIVSCIDLVLAIGLCVDYAAHVGES